MEFIKYKKKSRPKNTSVIQTDVSHFKTEVLHLRIDGELKRNLEERAAQLGQHKSQVARDILTDHFLEENYKAWQKEVKDWQK